MTDSVGTKDPVCGMTVEQRPETPVSEFEGRAFYFCNEACKRTFDADPHAYID